MFWDRLATAVTSRWSWAVAVVVVMLAGLAIGLAGANESGNTAPVTLPPSAESARAKAAEGQFPGADRVTAIVVAVRADGTALLPSDVAALSALPGVTPPVRTSEDGQAAIALVPLPADLSGFALGEKVDALRSEADSALPDDLRVHVTGGPAFGADIANSFTNANVTLLIVTALVVAILLILTYRSPVLWLVPLIVIGVADRVATSVGTVVAQASGLSFDGSTAGITSVLVFGAGTNYALLLISRYREELRRGPQERDERGARHARSHTFDHRLALRRAVRAAGPAILASNATVVLALLTLILATIPSTRSLGVLAACGLVVAAVFALLVLPPVLALCGRRLFWPFIPKPGGTDLAEAGPWHRVAAAVSHRPVMFGTVTIVVLAGLATGLLSTPIGLTQTEQFRVRADSVAGFDVLAEHFPGGSASPTVVIADTSRADAVQRAIRTAPGVVSVNPTGESGTGLTRWSVVLAAAPASPESFDSIEAMRTAVQRAAPGSLVGGADAEALDTRDAATRDRLVVMPTILAVVLVVLYVLLRAAIAPLILVGATVLSAMAALGLGGWASVHVFGFPALDYSTPLFAFLFLVALGVDYTIFLVTRAREETPQHGTRHGMVRAVSATGGVITSAGIVLAAVFCVLGVLPLIVLTQLGIIVGLGILLDTFVVRTLVIPALFALIGPRIWWPSRLDPVPSSHDSGTGVAPDLPAARGT